jgi:hypothetical protein
MKFDARRFIESCAKGVGPMGSKAGGGGEEEGEGRNGGARTSRGQFVEDRGSRIEDRGSKIGRRLPRRPGRNGAPTSLGDNRGKVDRSRGLSLCFDGRGLGRWARGCGWDPFQIEASMGFRSRLAGASYYYTCR